MNIAKLKIDKYTNVQIINFPDKYRPEISSDKNGQVQVIIYYIDTIQDTVDFIDYVKSADLSKDNRVIFVYEKGRKDGVNRDTIFEHFKKEDIKTPGLFKLRAPMMCSLSDKLSGFVQSYEG